MFHDRGPLFIRFQWHCTTEMLISCRRRCELWHQHSTFMINENWYHGRVRGGSVARQCELCLAPLGHLRNHCAPAHCLVMVRAMCLLLPSASQQVISLTDVWHIDALLRCSYFNILISKTYFSESRCNTSNQATIHYSVLQFMPQEMSLSGEKKRGLKIQII